MRNTAILVVVIVLLALLFSLKLDETNKRLDSLTTMNTQVTNALISTANYVNQTSNGGLATYLQSTQNGNNTPSH